jgi:hypothetical protein
MGNGLVYLGDVLERRVNVGHEVFVDFEPAPCGEDVLIIHKGSFINAAESIRTNGIQRHDQAEPFLIGIRMKQEAPLPKREGEESVVYGDTRTLRRR